MAIAPRARFTWKLRSRSIGLGERTRVMGILNVTPDSFSDGGQFLSVDAALKQAIALLDAGADIIDIGGESTRPGAGAGTHNAISELEEQRRILPLIEALMHTRPTAVISVDTYRANTAREALRRGAEIVNDVSGMQWDSHMAGVCADAGCGIIAMHTRGRPSEWATLPVLRAAEVLPLILGSLRSAAVQLLLAGCERQSIMLDPGFGFGKYGGANWVLLREFERLKELGFPLVAGLSRKGFLRITASTTAEATAMSREALDDASAMANTIAALGGAHLLRVHDVARTVRAVAVADTLRAAMMTSSEAH